MDMNNNINIYSKQRLNYFTKITSHLLWVPLFLEGNFFFSILSLAMSSSSMFILSEIKTTLFIRCVSSTLATAVDFPDIMMTPSSLYDML